MSLPKRERCEREQGSNGEVVLFVIYIPNAVLKSARSFLISLYYLSSEGGREAGKTSPMELYDKLRKVWNGIALRLSIRKRGQLKLRHDVRACEYADVHVMWKMLKRNETETVQFSRKRENKSLWRSFHWASWDKVEHLEVWGFQQKERNLRAGGIIILSLRETMSD
ncbi:hypothetical protein OIU85_020981 [Salix viminalis]|uniref:Uncharacterized protein n=1 Tax=Salix viminalis TaxID=40686 RepID=A0A9Q0ZD46_SALVM|nr:hypothetical protein OIU85_020981 [Salix viminalis]